MEQTLLAVVHARLDGPTELSHAGLDPRSRTCGPLTLVGRFLRESQKRPKLLDKLHCRPFSHEIRLARLLALEPDERPGALLRSRRATCRTLLVPRREFAPVEHAHSHEPRPQAAVEILVGQPVRRAEAAKPLQGGAAEGHQGAGGIP